MGPSSNSDTMNMGSKFNDMMNQIINRHQFEEQIPEKYEEAINNGFKFTIPRD